MKKTILESEMSESIFNKVYFKSSANMKEIPNDSVALVITSPPYFNIKDYSKDGYQKNKITKTSKSDVGNTKTFTEYIEKLLPIWQECFRVLKPNGKLCINVPLMPMLKRDMNTHHNRDIFDLQASIQQSILQNTKFFLMDLYLWNRTNSSKRLMFGSYPYPNNFYAQNTTEFITVYVKDGKPEHVSKKIKEASKLSESEWVEYTKQIWNIPIPNKSDSAYGKHSAIMPEEIVRRCVKMFSFVDDLVLDPFAGSGTTLKVAKELQRKFVGYEIYKAYEKIINEKINYSQHTDKQPELIPVVNYD